MHFQVPQYLDVEDKIIGPLTLKQFLILLFGGGLIFLLYNALKFSVFIIIAIPVAIFVLLLAFYKVNNQKFTQVAISFLGFIAKPNIYTWKKQAPKRPEQEPAPKIIKKAEPATKKTPEDELEEAQWKAEIQK